MSDSRVSVLLDTNVFVAAHWSRSSASARLIRACIEGRIVPHCSREVKREIDAVLRRIKANDAYLRSLEPFWERVVQVEGKPLECVRTEDPEDQKFLEAAAAGETDFLVTNDDHLLRVGYVGRAEIITPGSLARVLGLTAVRA